MGAKDPTGAEDQIIRPARLQSPLTRQLGLAINALRVRFVAFGIGTLASTVEDIIGRIMNDQGPQTGSLLAQDTGRDSVDRLRQPGLRFRLVHRRVRRRIDDHLRPDFRHQPPDCIRIRQIALIKIDSHHLAQRRQRPLQLEANLAVLTGKENFH